MTEIIVTIDGGNDGTNSHSSRCKLCRTRSATTIYTGMLIRRCLM